MEETPNLRPIFNQDDAEFFMHVQGEALLRLLPNGGGIIIPIIEEWQDICPVDRVVLEKKDNLIYVGRADNNGLKELPEGVILNDVNAFR